MNALEDLVASSVAAAPLPPSFNNTLVVSEDLEMNSGGLSIEDGANEELKTNAFCPADVSSIMVPAWDEFPRSPGAFDDDPDAVAGASV